MARTAAFETRLSYKGYSSEGRMGAAMKELFAQKLAVELRSAMRDEREEKGEAEKEREEQ